MSNASAWEGFPFTFLNGRKIEGIVATTGEHVDGVIDTVTLERDYLVFGYFDNERRSRSFRLNFKRDSWYWTPEVGGDVHLVTRGFGKKPVSVVTIKGF